MKEYTHPLEMPAPVAALASPDPVYHAPISVVQSAATVAGTPVWALRNGATKLVTFDRLLGTLGFVGTPAASTLRYGLYRFTAVSPTGGTAITPAEADTASPASGIAVCRVLDTGLGGAMVYETSPITVLALPIASIIGLPVTGLLPSIAVKFDLDLSDVKLRADEGLAIRIQDVSTIAGTSFVGDIRWSEGSL